MNNNIIKPSIVLVRPQLPENIGMVARAMDNNGLENLILVSPREIWPNETAIKSAANSKLIIKNTKVYNSLNKALKNFDYVIATSNRKRFLLKPLEYDFKNLFLNFKKHRKIAIIFGPENSGLSNEDLKLADIIFTINLSKTNQSLNLAHAVLIIAFKWRENFKLDKKINNNIINNIASKKEFINFIDFLKNELDEVGFLAPKSKSKRMFQNIQSMFLRAKLTKSEINTLWGMIKKLRKYNENKRI